ncbi:hypothetical protein ACFPK5_29595 [Streptomyces beijiangensis]
MEAHPGVAVTMHQQRLDNGVLQPPATLRHAVSASLVCGQAYQDSLRCG